MKRLISIILLFCFLQVQNVSAQNSIAKRDSGLVMNLIKKYNKGNFKSKEALAILRRAERIALASGNKRLIAICYERVGGVYCFNESNYNLANVYYLKALKICE